MHSRLATALFATIGVVTSQAAQLVGPVVDASDIIRSTLGFQNANLFRGACRDQQGSYWTCALNNGTWFAVRIDTSNQVTGIVNTGVSASTVHDMTFDAQRQNVWILWISSSQVRVISATSGTVIGSFGGSNRRGIAWDGADRVYIENLSQHFDADTFAMANNGFSAPASTQGLAHDPTSARFWTGSSSSADPAGTSSDSFRQHPTPGASMPAELSFPTNPGVANSARGGNVAGMDTWQDPATGDWLGVFCQRQSNGDVKLYTARFSESTGGNCGGPSFSAGPSVVQDQLYASGTNLSTFAWLLVAPDYASFTAPIFAPGCTVEVGPSAPTIFGAYLPNFNGNLSVNEPVPLLPALRELPLYFQWVTLDFSGTILLSEGRSCAIKQF